MHKKIHSKNIKNSILDNLYKKHQNISKTNKNPRVSYTFKKLADALSEDIDEDLDEDTIEMIINKNF